MSDSTPLGSRIFHSEHLYSFVMGSPRWVPSQILLILSPARSLTPFHAGFRYSMIEAGYSTISVRRAQAQTGLSCFWHD